MVKVHSPIRWEVVLELRAIVNQHPEWKMEQKYFAMVRYRNDPTMGTSILEDALALYPNDFLPPKKKGDLPMPTHSAICKTYSTRKRFRKWLKNDSVVPYAITNEKGESLTYNFQTKKEYKDRQNRFAKNKAGIDKMDVKNLGILSKKPTTRQLSVEQLESVIEQCILEKKKRRKEIEVTN